LLSDISDPLLSIFPDFLSDTLSANASSVPDLSGGALLDDLSRI
jgi:hypothetical protein